MGLLIETTIHFLPYLITILNVISAITYGHIAHDCRSNIINSPKQKREEDVLPSIKKNTQRFGKGSNKNQRRKNVDLQCMLKTKEANGTLIANVQNT
jgi:hypothetical protein